MFRTFIILCIACTFVQGKSTNTYDNFKVFRVDIPDEAAAKFVLNDLKNYVDIWAEPRIGHHSDIMIPPKDLDRVVNMLKQASIGYSVMIRNVQTLINAEQKPTSRKYVIEEQVSADHPMTWDDYHSQDDMEAYMDYLVKQYPDLVSIEEIGKSYEGRTMRVLKVCKGGACGQKPGLWIDGGIHAREWISPSTVTFIMKELVENSDNYPAELLDKLDWYILPVLNPDGYEYTRTTNRMWRKSRYCYCVVAKLLCKIFLLVIMLQY